ncbi:MULTISPECIES: GIDE domain-containing protein [Pseudonocardia]|uniref:RING-type E3 ubiquitin transferase n=2 Tax=Pseudonocardia TaxID=1847 RepID=A0A1Y2MQ04_PSEAH|nr:MULTISPECIES: GIDE domain-containing protein [Pseudonocardia]OSY37300.1 E3 Ubiquitin ligase [Pseudonocardia autotrophica]TDN72403.1 E3 ubiquitin ligase [Pseudonocardia autotrophica]BBG03112.1 hypothetical protein Pdca_43210 [Pseudonocardia autotrophica]GEC23731.1 hypothetical protein PSA01_07600 [Pseudonocardia saturnea]
MTTFQLVLLAFAGIMGWRAWTAFGTARAGHERWTRGLGATQTGVAELVGMADAVRSDLDPGAFRKVVALAGTVEPVPDGDGDGSRPAGLTGTPSVWFRVLEVRLSRGNKGETERQTVGDRRWDRPFRLRDGDATVIVDPRDARVEVRAAEQRQDAHEPDPSDRWDFGVFRMLDPTLSHERTEWRIEPGSRLTVIGQARISGDDVRLAAAPEQPLTLTSTDRSEHLEAGRRNSGSAMRGAVGYGAGALLVLVLVVLL